MTPVPLERAHALLEARLDLRITGHDGQTVSACIWPTRLTTSQVNGVVEWHGTDLLSSVVGGQGHESPWGQRFLLVWAAAGPQSVAVVPVLGAGQWRLARLTLPDLDGRVGDNVRVSLNRRHWTATLTLTRKVESRTTQVIPLELQKQDVGSVVVDMASRLLLQQPWLD